ncbi:hypothetical protein NDU88_005435 [Pleurodeles waltl]|uniref:Uncharacterized protein n=1 Tax=Pleurodeles waltl TaxID=8319 RepID=A0AAV7VLS4_PLEWA|nr:hypothetical protein NDU88_005435 [Pleurodeles waltl]
MDIKQGLGEKVVSKNKSASLDRYFEKGKDILVGGADTPPTAVEEVDPPVTEEMAAIDGPPPHEGGERQSDVVDVATLQKQVAGSQTEQRESAQSAMILSQVEQRPVILRDNKTIQGDTFFSLSDHSSWSSNEQLDLEADKTSSEFESEVSSLALGKELHESSRNATVRKKQRKRSEQVGPNKPSINPFDTKGLQGLQWEYSKDDLTLYDNGEKQPNPVSLETIYQSIMEHREESKLESRRTQMACRKMQMQIRRVAKTCSEFTTRMEEAETRISRLEDEAGAHQSSREVMEKQLEDTQWKLTDLKDRMRRNNLRSQKYGRVQLSEIPVVEAVKNGAKIGKLYKLLTELQVDDMVQQNERWIARLGVAGEWVDQSLAMADTTFLSANLKTQHYKTLMD